MRKRINAADKKCEMGAILKEYESLRNEIISNSNRNMQLLILLLTIYSVGFGYAIQSKLADIFMLLPLISIPVLIFYIREQLVLGAIGRYMGDEIENKKLRELSGKNLIEWQNYWNEARFVKEEGTREKVKNKGWFYKSLPTIWVTIFTAIPSSIACAGLIYFNLRSGWYFLFPTWFYFIVPPFYIIALLWILYDSYYMMNILRYGVPRGSKHHKTR